MAAGHLLNEDAEKIKHCLGVSKFVLIPYRVKAGGRLERSEQSEANSPRLDFFVTFCFKKSRNEIQRVQHKIKSL
jgi:hypothetical protein